MNTIINKKSALLLYKKIYTIRQSEIAIQKYYFEDDMKTPMHMSMGEEAIVSGVCHALSDSDQVLGTYRSHALYLAKTLDIKGFFAEMYGKKSGCAKGKSGSMHLSCPELGHMGSSAIVATTIPVSVGCALSNKMLNSDKICAAFFGDGATNEGAFWESINFAALKKLPILFVCEDNGLAVHTSYNTITGYKDLYRLIDEFDFNLFCSSSTDAEEIYTGAHKVVRDMKLNGNPGFILAKYHRQLEHVGVNEDYDAKYREKPEFLFDSVGVQRDNLLKWKILEKDILDLERSINKEVEDAIEFAKSESFSSIQETYQDVFV